MNHHSWSYRIVALLAFVVLVASGLSLPAAVPRAQAAPAQDTLAAPAFTPSSAPTAGTWVFQGPAPELNAQQDLVNVAAADEPANGNVISIAASPTNADVVYVAGANGGVWKTTNATATNPAWTPLTDNLKSLSIGPIALDPLDATDRTLVVGTGQFSGFANRGDDLAGLYYTTDGGATWTTSTSSLLSAAGITGVAARGTTLLAASGNGLFRSTTGVAGTWSKISAAGVLPNAPARGLIGDPNNADRLYATFTGAAGGIFRTDDRGATWTNVTTGIAGISSATSFMNASVGKSSVVYVMLNGTVGGVTANSVYRSLDNGATWTVLDTPTGGFSTNTTGQFNTAISADKNNIDLVYVTGYATTVYRLDASKPAGSQITNIAQNGATADLKYGAPHTDSTYLAMDVNGGLLLGCHGGLFRLQNPSLAASATNYWVSKNGNLGVNEIHDVAYDHVSHIILGGIQDNGVAYQSAQGSQSWPKAPSSSGDGGDVVVADIGGGQSARYHAYQSLGNFRRQVYNAANGLVSNTTIGSSVVTDPQFVTPLAVNAIIPQRLMIGGSGHLYETLNEGGTITALGQAVGGNRPSAVAYGGRRNGVANPDVLYVGFGNKVYARTTAGGVVTATATLPAGVGTIQDVVMNPDDWMNVFAIDDNQVFRTTDGGITWSDITGNLVTSGLSSTSFTAIEYVPGAAGYIAVGTRSGAFASQISSLGTWVKLGTGLPDVPVYELVYDATDNVLAAATLGRGVWTLSNAAAAFTALSASVTTSSAASLSAKPDVAGKPFGSHATANQSSRSHANPTAVMSALASTCFGPASGQVSCWSGDGTANDAWDGNNGTLQNGTTFATGLVGQAFSFDGVDDYVNVPDANNLDFTTDFTIDAWVYQNAQQSGEHVVVGKGRGVGSTGYALAITNGQAGLALNNNVTNCVAGDSQTLALGQWNHIAGTFSGSTVKVYVNGQLRATQACSFSSLLVSTQPLNIGREVVGLAGRNYAGLADEVQVYNRALDLAEIQSIYNAGLNHAPVAIDDSYSTNQDTPLTVAAPGVLANDNDADSNPLTTAKVSDPANGTVTLNSDGSFTYTPNAGFFGSDSFTYTANDGYADSNVATVTITVQHVPTASVTGPASALAGQQTTFVFHAADSIPAHQAAGFTYNIDWGDGATETVDPVIGNGDAIARHAYATTGNKTIQVTATDKDGAVSAPASAAISISAMTTPNLQAVIATTPIVYLAPASDAALHSEASAINGLSAPASPSDITIVLGDGPYTGVTLSPPDNIVLDLAGTHTTDNPGTQITGASPAVTVTSGEVFVQGEGLTTATDSPTVLVTGGHLTLGQNEIQESTGANNVAVKLTGGTLTVGFDIVFNINGQGSFFQTYDPDAIGFPDGIDADLTPNNFSVNGTPVSAFHLSATDLESSANPSAVGHPVTFTAGIDVEADELGEATGTVTFYEGSTVLGTGTVSEVGFEVFEASFTTSALSAGSHTITAVYNGNDVYVASSAQLTQIVQTNHVPVAVGDSYSTFSNAALTVAAPGVLGNDTDADSDQLTAIKVTNPAHGTVTLNADGSFTYAPASNYAGPDSFTYKANDGEADSNVATVSITVNNRAPVAVGDSYTTKANTALTVSAPGVLSNDTDADGNPLTAIKVTDPAHGTVTLNPNGSFTYTPATNYAGPDSFTYKANDGTADSNVATVSIAVGYTFSGFFGSVTNPPTFNQTKAGSNIAFIFSLGGNDGLNIFASGYPQSQQIDCTSGVLIGSPAAASAASPLSYNATTGRYTYTSKTDKSWANTCRQFNLRTADGTDHFARFKFK